MKFLERKERIRNLSKNIDSPTNFQLLSENLVEELYLSKIKNSVIFYVFVSLINSFKEEKFNLCENFLNKYEKFIFNLPNMTPNGLILPKRENFLAYHEIHKNVAELLRLYGFETKAEFVHNPINIRFVKGNEEGSNRPKASTKLHTDIWAGEFANSLMIFLPLFGDIDNIGVDFYEPPQDFYPHYIKILDDYNEGSHFINSSEKYDCPLKNGFMYIIDSFLLHRTFKKSNKWRLSLDFRFLPYEKLESDIEISTDRDENYISYDDWKSIGYSKLLFSDLKIDKFENNANKNSYASKYEIINLP